MAWTMFGQPTITAARQQPVNAWLLRCPRVGRPGPSRGESHLRDLPEAGYRRRMGWRRGPVKLLLALCIAHVAPHELPAQTVIQFTSFNSHAYSDSTSRMIGWEFSVTQIVTISQLGWLDWGLDGLAASHQVGIWDTADAQLLISATVPAGTAATLVNQFRVIDLSTPLQLQPGRTYRIAGFDPGSSDPHVWNAALSGYPSIEVAGFTIDSRITIGAGLAIGPAVGTFSYPGSTIGDSRSTLLGPTFTLLQVPEPSTAVLGLLGIAVLLLPSLRRRRQRTMRTQDGVS